MALYAASKLYDMYSTDVYSRYDLLVTFIIFFCVSHIRILTCVYLNIWMCSPSISYAVLMRPNMAKQLSTAADVSSTH
jgi:hypothetical protein